MVTGDNQVTAEAIAQECGIVKDHKLWRKVPDPEMPGMMMDEATGLNPNYDPKEHVYLGKQFWAAVGPVIKEEVKDKKTGKV
jgi:magnesium-transporting ATPase (P-type)